MAEFQNWNLGREFQAGLESGQQRRRQDQFRALAGQAINAPAAERDALIQQAIANDPESGFALQKQLDSDTDRRQAALFNMARGFKQIHSKNPAAAAAFYQQQIAPGLKRLGFQVSDQYNEDEVVPVVEQVLAAYGGGGQSDVKVVGNSLVDSTGNVVYQAPQRFQTDRGLIEIGSDGIAREVTLGGPPPAQGGPAQGAVVTNQQGERGRYSIGADGMPVFIAEGVAPNIEQGITADPAAFQQPVAEAPAQFVQSQGQPILPRGASAEQERLRLAREANARAEQANQRAQEAADRAKRASEAKGAVGKPLTQGVVTDLTKDAGKLDNLENLVATFKDDYAGNVVGGSIENLAGRLGGERVGAATPGQADWWQQYDRYKNEVRNELFGASLTAGEQAAFEAADVIPNMDPKVARKNLATQREIIRKGLERKGRTWAAQGYNREAISEATGLNFRGATAQPQPKTIRYDARGNRIP